jgi:uncharacterized protein YjbJ (UPF0337 family)
MSTLVAKGNWNIAKGKLKQQLARLMQDDLQFFEGKVDELVGRIQKRASSPRKAGESGSCDTDQCACRHHEG